MVVRRPYLYTAEVTLYDKEGRVADKTREHFGMRTIELSPQHGLLLNGQKVLLKGYANHHTLGALGAAAYPRAIEQQILTISTLASIIFVHPIILTARTCCACATSMASWWSTSCMINGTPNSLEAGETS